MRRLAGRKDSIARRHCRASERRFACRSLLYEESNRCDLLPPVRVQTYALLLCYWDNFKTVTDNFLTIAFVAFQQHTRYHIIVHLRLVEILGCIIRDIIIIIIRAMTHAPETGSRNRNRRHRPKFDAKFCRQFFMPMRDF